MLAGQNPVHSKLEGAREALIIMLEKFFLYNHLWAMIGVLTLDKRWIRVLGGRLCSRMPSVGFPRLQAAGSGPPVLRALVPATLISLPLYDEGTNWLDCGL